jgi:probable F420-dependent oxidoreductase
MEKPVPRLWGDIADPLIALALASAATTTLKLGTAIIVVPARNPTTLAKEVATLDMYSGDRLLFGIGVGGLQEETQILGVDFDHRWTQGKEAVEAIMKLWTRERSEYHGSYYDFPPVYCFPKPGRRSYPPITLGSKAPNAFKRIAAWGDGWLPLDISTAEVARGRAEIDRLARINGHDPASIEISVMGVPPDRESIEAYTDAGADRIVLGVGGAGDEQALVDLERIAEMLM